MQIREPLFRSPILIVSDHGDAVSVAGLDKSTAIRHAETLVSIHSLIPFVRWTKDELLSETLGQRVFHHKWQLSILATREPDEPIGFLISYLRAADGNFGRTSVYMHRMAILEHFQRRGIGRQAVTLYLQTVFTRLPVDFVTLQTNDNRGNAPIIRFYETLGFSKTKRLFYPDKVDWLMVRPRVVGAHIPKEAMK